MDTYLFYDIETSGLNKCFDQVVQFAAIRTDLELNEIERHNFFIKLNNDVVLSPQAFLTHQISFATLENGICEYDAMRQIHQLLNTPNTISVGYNNLGFDDEFLRFSFYRNLLPPYTHQYANGCRRMDLYPMAVMYFLFNRDHIRWPMPHGNVSFKLEKLNEANQFLPNVSAHDALIDTQVTLELARHLIKERKMWDYLCGYFNKNTDIERCNKLPISFAGGGHNFYAGLMVEGNFGAQKYFQSLALYLGMHNHYKNQCLWLQLDNDNLQKASIDTVAQNTFVIRKRLGETPLLLPLHSRFKKYLTKEREKQALDNVAMLRSDKKLLQAIINYHKEYKYPDVPHVDLDAALYQIGFFSDRDYAQCFKFHAANLPEKFSLVQDFYNPILRKQAIRLLGRNYRQSLPENLTEQYEDYLRTINPQDNTYALVDYRNDKKLTKYEALRKVQELESAAGLSDMQRKVIADFKLFFLGD